LDLALQTKILHMYIILFENLCFTMTKVIEGYTTHLKIA